MTATDSLTKSRIQSLMTTKSYIQKPQCKKASYVSHTMVSFPT